MLTQSFVMTLYDNLKHLWIGAYLQLQLSFQIRYCGFLYVVCNWHDLDYFSFPLAQKIFLLQIFVEMWLHHYSLEMYQKMQSPHVKVTACTSFMNITWWLTSYLRVKPPVLSRGVFLFCFVFWYIVQRKELVKASVSVCQKC